MQVSGLNRKVRLMNDKVYEKYAWIIFFVIGAITIVAAVPHALGLNTDPALVESIAGKSIDDLKVSNPMFFNLYNFYFSSGGLSDLGFAFLRIEGGKSGLGILSGLFQLSFQVLQRLA
jgi:hypothetical protein